MKQRFFSAALTLCLCISSQSVAYAWQGDSLAPGHILADGSETSDAAGTEPQEDVSLPEETEDEPETSDAAGTEPQEDVLLPEESVDELETSDDAVTDLPEDALLPEETVTEETEDEPEFSDEVVTELPEDAFLPEEALTAQILDEPVTRDSVVPTPAEAYAAMIALKEQDRYKEGTTWTNDEPYSDSKGYYHWKGGMLNGTNISAVGCVAFSFILSDAAFGSLPARMYAAGGFSFEDIKVGDILRLSNDTHTVIVLEVSDAGVVVAEGNYNDKVHWGRAMSKEEVMADTSHYITRYPEGYIPPDDPGANEWIADGTLAGGLTWSLTRAGTLIIAGKGAMPDFGSTGEQPWNSKGSEIRKVVIEDGVTSVGSCAFWDCGVLSAEIPSSVTAIGSNAFYGSSLVSITIPSSVRTIGDSAFRQCQNLGSVAVPEGVEVIGENVFSGCTGLKSATLPASVKKVGAGTFFECKEMKSAAFAPGSGQVVLGDNLFTRCYELMSVTLPQNIDRIGEGMFLDCLMLASVEIPQGAEIIGGLAFASCSSLTTVVIPDSVTTIGTAAFQDCSLTDIYFAGTEAQWKNIQKLGDMGSVVSKVNIHYNATPATRPDPSPNPGDGGNDNNTDDNHSGKKPENSSATPASGKDFDESAAEAAADTWKPTTPDEIRRYACMGRETVRYTPLKDNACQIDIENAMQGPMCFQSFETVLGDYTIGRTYNIYALSDTTYSTDQEIQFTIEIPPAIYNKDREYKMICVTKGGQPILYDDLDDNPETVTIKTDKFYAYALIYK